MMPSYVLDCNLVAVRSFVGLKQRFHDTLLLAEAGWNTSCYTNDKSNTN